MTKKVHHCRRDLKYSSLIPERLRIFFSYSFCTPKLWRLAEWLGPGAKISWESFWQCHPNLRYSTLVLRTVLDKVDLPCLTVPFCGVASLGVKVQNQSLVATLSGIDSNMSKGVYESDIRNVSKHVCVYIHVHLKFCLHPCVYISFCLNHKSKVIVME